MKPSLLTTVIAAPLILYKPATNIAFKPFTAFKLYLWLCKCNWFWSRITFDAAAASLLKGAKLWLNCSLTEIVIKQLKPWSAEASKITKVFEVKKKKMRSLAPVAAFTFLLSSILHYLRNCVCLHFASGAFCYFRAWAQCKITTLFSSYCEKSWVTNCYCYCKSNLITISATLKLKCKRRDFRGETEKM